MKFRKILAMTVAAVITVVALALPVSAESIEDTAASKQNGSSFSVPLGNSQFHDYKVKLTKGGELKISLTSMAMDTHIWVFNSGGEILKGTRTDILGSGDWSYMYGYAFCYWNKTMEKYKGTIVYSPLPKGTYYIRIWGSSSNSSNGKATVKFTFPGASENTESEAPVLTLKVKKGDTAALGIAPSSDDVEWKSSKSSVASVDEDGTVTAKKTGTAIVTAKIGKTKLKIQIVVK